MGTRHLTYVYEGETPLMCMYGQWDGYPSGYGADLAKFLNSFDAIVNGIPLGDNRKMANGMGCLAAQLVANFKVGAGSFYIYPPILNQDSGQEYEYHVFNDKIFVADGWSNEVLFDGSWNDFAEFCTENEDA